ncbi:glycoside hydrolase family 57 protein [Metallosphaera javensis (ex Sakai et al. 2022)]|uniref:glycoside hydrolase family 57 protein n=1 Tax=Metallosphaera javensis (ex Sakai et al. 2022) TaxID=2775498 RepID=UPI00258C4C0B|nr:MAG: alpha-amylase [Metallosphaera javensis (ex Sakai et al. 2022)]
MTSKVIMGFEVHQPFRIRKDAFWNPRFRGSPQDKYFDDRLNREIFERVRAKCYIPATNIILEEIEAGEDEGREVKFFYSVSGTLLEQAERWGRDFLDLLQLLSSTGKVEFLAQTYYHSVTSMWEDRTEWREQVRLHAETVRSLLGQTPVTFENTELLTNLAVVEEAESMGFKGIMMEGKESVLKGKSPNFVYRRKGGKISILPRNFTLSDDIAFRFSNPNWDQYPLTAEKYSSWIKASPGQVVTVFVDYETFGEHHWKESGILEFLRWLPRELNREGVEMTLPREVESSPYYDLEVTGTSSWADIRKDHTSWLGNIMQWAYDEAVRRSEMTSKELGGDFLKAWRYFTTSDNYYYLFTEGGGPGEVHSYFNAYNSPIDAFLNEFYAINSFLHDELEKLGIKNEPFFFYKDGKRVGVAWDENQFREIVKRDESLKDHLKYLKEWLQ